MASNLKTLRRDVIIIGAGIHGLAAAKTFRQCDPLLDVCIIDSGSSIGGVWRKEALYPDIKTNNEFGTYEFSDFPIPDSLGVKKGEHVPGLVVHRYLNSYAEIHGLRELCLLDTKVESVERSKHGWKVECLSTLGHQDHYIMECTKLVVATGLTSSPASIQFNGAESFRKPIINAVTLPSQAPKLLSDPAIRHVTVLGSGKSSWDSAYLFASHGKRVSWIIRESGRGPPWMTYIHSWLVLGPIKLLLITFTTFFLTRFVTFLSPCLWGSADGFGRIRSLFHNTRVGRSIVKAFYDNLGHETLLQSGLLRDEGLRCLIPDHSAMWVGVGLGILNYPTHFHDFVSNGQIQVIRKDIASLSGPGTISFTDLETSPIETNALICNIGWNHVLPFDFRPHSVHASMGIPSVHHSQSQLELWSKLEQQADVEILERFPILRTAPKDKRVSDTLRPESQLTPWRLYRGIAPPGLVTKDQSDHNIVFLGMMLTIYTTVRAEMSSLWAYSWMTGKLDAKCSFRLGSPCLSGLQLDASSDKDVTQREILYDTALFNRYPVHRTPLGFSRRFPDFAFDDLTYLDLLQRDLGLDPWRKTKGLGWLGELFSGGYMPKHWNGFVEEWIAKRESKDKKEN